MHRALRIPEVLDEIIDHLPRQSMSSAARACRAFYTPAMGHLWGVLSWDAFVDCCIAFDVQESTDIVDPSLNSKSGRYSMFLASIRVLKNATSITLLTKALESFDAPFLLLRRLGRSREPQYLYPSLLSVTFYAFAPERLLHVLSFIGPQLQTLVLDTAYRTLARNQNDAWIAYWKVVLGSIGGRCTGLRRCELFVPLALQSALREHLLLLLDNLSRIRCLSLGESFSDTQIWERVAALTSLERLRLDVAQTLEASSKLPTAMHSFNKLRRSDLRVTIIEGAIAMLPHIPASIPSLTVTVMCDPQAGHHAKSVSTLCSAVCERFGGLRDFRICLNRSTDDAPSFDVCSPILACKQIRIFKFQLERRTGPTMLLKDSHIRAIAVAWPDLRVLDLNLGGPPATAVDVAGTASTAPTWEAVLYLTEQCPRISQIALNPFDVSVIPAPLPKPARDLPICLNVIGPPTGSPWKTAKLLVSAFSCVMMQELHSRPGNEWAKAVMNHIRALRQTEADRQSKAVAFGSAVVPAACLDGFIHISENTLGKDDDYFLVGFDRES